jgi:hypothetical protein
MNGPTTEQARVIIDRAKRDPVWWVREVLGDEPWGVQQDILNSVRDNRRTTVRSCHAAGKSWLAARCVKWFASTFAPAKVITTAPTFRQVQKIIWQEIRKAHKNSKVPLGGEMLLNEWKLDDGWYAFGFSTDDPDAFQGSHADHILLIFDEAAGVDPKIWEAGDSILSAGKIVRFLTIGNPTEGSGSFFNEHRDPGTKKFKISAFDTPNFTKFGITLEDIQANTWRAKIGTSELPTPWLISPEWVWERLKWGVDSPMFMSRVLAEFPEAGKDTLIPLSLIEAAQRRELDKGYPHELGADIARYGDDLTVVYERWGPRARLLVELAKQSTMRAVGEIAKVQNDGEPGILAKIDTIGVGSGVFDRLEELEHMVEEVIVSRAPKDKERFGTLRDEAFWGLRERFVEGDIDIDELDETLAAQLSAMKYKIDSRGRIRVESKDDMKGRGLQSPNHADGLMIAMHGSKFEYGYDSTNKQQEEETRRVSKWGTSIGAGDKASTRRSGGIL